MKSEKADMETIFNQLSDQNKDILILVAKGMKLAQETADESRKRPQKTTCQ